ncbi:MAG TPA: glycosyltransferase [Planctomycetota bacterium]|nr:glycosyltransferase [Planctomycetota bacterium]
MPRGWVVMSAPPTSPRAWILQLGNDQLTPKACYYGNELVRRGLHTYYFSEDRSGLSRSTIERHELPAEIVPRGLLRRSWRLVQIIRRLRPRAVELFLSAKPWHLLAYLMILRLFRVPIVVWCRGEIRDYEKHHPLRRFAFRRVIRASRAVLLRELHMDDVLERNGVVARETTSFFPNSVPLGPEPNLDGRRTILYMNALRAWRHPELVVEAAHLLRDAIPDLRVRIVGATSGRASYLSSLGPVEEGVQARIRELGLETIVELLPFTDRPADHFRDAAVFLLPADIVFCNYSLIEAMAAGVVPIVADVDGADLIVEDGVSGFLVPRDANAIAERVRLLLEDEPLRRRMAMEARRRIAERFSVESAAARLFEIYASVIAEPAPRARAEPVPASPE